MVIFAFVVDKLEEVYETPYGGLERWHLQLGEEDEGYLRWLRVAQLGDRPCCELTLEQVTLDPERVSRSTWKFLVCKGRQMTETVWLTAVARGTCLCRVCWPTPRPGWDSRSDPTTGAK